MEDIQGRFKSLIVYKDEVIVVAEDLNLVLERIAAVYPLLDEKVNNAINNIKGAITDFEVAWDEA